MSETSRHTMPSASDHSIGQVDGEQRQPARYPLLALAAALSIGAFIIVRPVDPLPEVVSSPERKEAPMVGYVVIFKGIDHEDQEIAEATSYVTVDGFVEFKDENNAVLYRISTELFGGCYRMGKARYIP